MRYRLKKLIYDKLSKLKINSKKFQSSKQSKFFKLNVTFFYVNITKFDYVKKLTL